jgi:hypothetical protein
MVGLHQNHRRQWTYSGLKAFQPLRNAVVQHPEVLFAEVEDVLSGGIHGGDWRRHQRRLDPNVGALGGTCLVR